MFLKDLICAKLELATQYYTRLSELLEVKTLFKKDFLIEEGEICSFIGFVKTGVLRSYLDKDGKEFNIDFYFPESIVTSYRSFLTREPSIGSIQALENSTILCLSQTNYDLLLNESKAWFKVAKYISDTLFVKKCQKDISLLMNTAYERYKLLLQTYPNVEQLVPQYHIASYIGIEPESLSRLKSLNISQ